MWTVPLVVVLSIVQFMDFYKITVDMTRNLFKIYFYLDAEILQGNTAVLSIPHSLKRLVTSGWNFSRIIAQQLCWFGPNNKLKILSLNFQQVEVSFQKKNFWILIFEFLNFEYYSACFFSFRWFADEVVYNRVNYQGYRYDVYFFQYYTVIHFMNGEGVCWLSEELFSMYAFVYDVVNLTKVKRHDIKPGDQK